jgi:hypothetical protein
MSAPHRLPAERWTPAGDELLRSLVQSGVHTGSIASHETNADRAPVAREPSQYSPAPGATPRDRCAEDYKAKT